MDALQKIPLSKRRICPANNFPNCIPVCLPSSFGYSCNSGRRVKNLNFNGFLQNYRVAIYGTTMILVGLAVYFIFIFRDNQIRAFKKIDGMFRTSCCVKFVVSEIMVVCAQLILNLEFDDPPKGE